jgi:hypothetical protein
VGGGATDVTRVPLLVEMLASCKQSDAVLVAVIGGYKWDINERHLRLFVSWNLFWTCCIFKFVACYFFMCLYIKEMYVVINDPWVMCFSQIMDSWDFSFSLHVGTFS